MSRANLLKLRDVAERLPLGEHGARCLRDLFIELIDEITDSGKVNESLTLTAAREPAPAPELVGVHGVALPMSAPAGATRDMAAPAGHVPDPAGEDWLAAQMAADAKAEAEAAAAAKTAPAKKNDTKAAPTPNGGH
jgi:hypothetical protein